MASKSAARAALPPGIEAENVYASLFAAYPDALLVVDGAGTIVMANAQAAELLGYGAGELVGLPVDALVPDSIRPQHAANRDAYGENPRPRPMGTHTELVAKRRDGSEVMVEIALSPLQDHGVPLVVAAIRGIGAYPRVLQALQRARYSEHLAQLGRLGVDSRDPQILLEQVPAIIAQALEAELAKLLLVEPNGLELRIVGGVGLLAGERIGSLIPNRPDTPYGCVMAEARPIAIEDYASERRFAVPRIYLDAGLKSGIFVPLLVRERVTGVVSVQSREHKSFADDEIRFLQSLANLLATRLQRAQSEEALNHAQRLESVGQLTGGIAHDFNNLLTVIQGNLQVLEELPALAQDPYAQQLVGAAARASRRGAELTSKLLAFSRRQVLQPSAIDVDKLVGSLADMLRRTLDQRIAIAVDVVPGCPPCLADPGQLESALLNIAINARDAMVEDDAEVRAVVHNFLEALGCKVECCASAEQALARLAQGSAIDVLVTDIALGPGMRGTQLAAEAQARLPQLGILLMSGFSAELLDANRESPPSWELLRKPFSREELARGILQAMEGFLSS
ncbi:MAG: PAS domain S-box protein [Rhizobacter sp.]